MEMQIFERVNTPRLVHQSPDGQIRREIDDGVATYYLQGIAFAQRDLKGLVAGQKLKQLESTPTAGDLPKADVLAAGERVQDLEEAEFGVGREAYVAEFRVKIGDVG